MSSQIGERPRSRACVISEPCIGVEARSSWGEFPPEEHCPKVPDCFGIWRWKRSLVESGFFFTLLESLGKQRLQPSEMGTPLLPSA